MDGSGDAAEAAPPSEAVNCSEETELTELAVVRVVVDGWVEAQQEAAVRAVAAMAAMAAMAAETVAAVQLVAVARVAAANTAAERATAGTAEVALAQVVAPV